MFYRLNCASALMLSAITAPAMSIVLNPDAGLAGNAPALAAFQRAAHTWSGMFSDPFTVNINAGLAVLANPSVIGQAQSTVVAGAYNLVRNAIVADAANEPSNGIVASLPTAAQFRAFVPSGFSLSGNIALTQANANALGFNLNFGPDGTITFNSSFGFDYDNTNGVLGGLIDFETVALHEIGHILGFISAVDEVDYYRSIGETSPISMTPLDLFRFSAGLLPMNAAQFTSNSRSLVPGQAAVFSDTINARAFSTGQTFGDGRQASHWKDDALTGTLIGVMDPTLGAGVIQLASAADFRAFDLIGYDLANPVPEPGTFALVGVGLAMMAFRRKRRS